MILLKRMILIFLSVLSSFLVFSRMTEYDLTTPGVCLPYIIEGTSIVLESIGESKTSGCAEAVLRNNGKEMLASFYVEIHTLSATYCFETTMLPSGARIVLRERNGRYWEGSSIVCSYGSCSVVMERGNCDLPDIIGDRMLLYNADLIPVKAMEIYLKPWDETRQLYLNGKTQKIVIYNLLGKDSVEVILPDSNYKIVYYIVNETAAAHDAAAECFIKELSKGNPVIWGAWVR